MGFALAMAGASNGGEGGWVGCRFGNHDSETRDPDRFGNQETTIRKPNWKLMVFVMVIVAALFFFLVDQMMALGVRTIFGLG